jgi:hypothetical protein
MGRACCTLSIANLYVVAHLTAADGLRRGDAVPLLRQRCDSWVAHPPLASPTPFAEPVCAYGAHMID